jgi:hypothetical protein
MKLNYKTSFETTENIQQREVKQNMDNVRIGVYMPVSK